MMKANFVHIYLNYLQWIHSIKTDMNQLGGRVFSEEVKAFLEYEDVFLRFSQCNRLALEEKLVISGRAQFLFIPLSIVPKKINMFYNYVRT